MHKSFGVIAIMLIACSSSNAPPGGSGATSGVSQRLLANGVEEIETAVCRYRTRCNGVVLSMNDCLSALQVGPSTFGSADALVSSVDAGLVEFDETHYDDCLYDTSNLSCFPLSGRPLDVPACRRAFVGLVASGGRCTTDFACADGGVCVLRSTGGACEGECVSSSARACSGPLDCRAGELCQLGSCIPVNAGARLDEPCGGFVACAAGLQCVRRAGFDYRCRPLGAQGQLCRVDGRNGCDEGLMCVAQAGTVQGQCLPLARAGDSCLETWACGGPQSGLYCDALSGVCVERPGYGECTFVGTKAYCARDDLYCDLSRVPPACVPLRNVGEPCRVDSECGPAGENVACVRGLDGLERCALIERIECMP